MFNQFQLNKESTAKISTKNYPTTENRTHAFDFAGA